MLPAGLPLREEDMNFGIPVSFFSPPPLPFSHNDPTGSSLSLRFRSRDFITSLGSFKVRDSLVSWFGYSRRTDPFLRTAASSSLWRRR